MSEPVRDRLVTAEDGIRHEGVSAKAPAPAAPALSRKHLGELYRKVDALFARARARHSSKMSCRAGCSDCCKKEFSVTALEAALMRDALAALPPEAKAALRAHKAESPGGCAALDGKGECAIYTSRPLSCRIQGMPVRSGPIPGVRALPVLEACPTNFVGQDLTALDAASIVDQRTLSNVLTALDSAFAEETGSVPGERIGVSALL